MRPLLKLDVNLYFYSQAQAVSTHLPYFNPVSSSALFANMPELGEAVVKHYRTGLFVIEKHGERKAGVHVPPINRGHRQNYRQKTLSPNILYI